MPAERVEAIRAMLMAGRSICEVVSASVAPEIRTTAGADDAGDRHVDDRDEDGREDQAQDHHRGSER